jgi:hypothetical protein
VLGVTNLTAKLAGPQRLAELICGEWAIEKQGSLCPRCDVRGRSVQGPHSLSPINPGGHAQLRDRRAAAAQLHQHRRGNPRGPR